MKKNKSTSILLACAFFLLTLISCLGGHTGLCQSLIAQINPGSGNNSGSCSSHDCGHEKSSPKCDFSEQKQHLHDYLIVSTPLSLFANVSIANGSAIIRKNISWRHKPAPKEIVPRFLFHETLVMQI